MVSQLGVQDGTPVQITMLQVYHQLVGVRWLLQQLVISQNAYYNFLLLLLQNLQARGPATPQLIVSDANAGLIVAIREGSPGAS
jgi:hypothetical protein